MASLNLKTKTTDSSIYVPRSPRSGLLYQTVKEHFQTFCEEAAVEVKPLAEYIEKEFQAYLDCGILEKGLIKLSCNECKSAMVVPFSCKRRGFCPSCLGKRMNEGAAF